MEQSARGTRKGDILNVMTSSPATARSGTCHQKGGRWTFGRHSHVDGSAALLTRRPRCRRLFIVCVAYNRSTRTSRRCATRATIITAGSLSAVVSAELVCAGCAGSSTTSTQRQTALVHCSRLTLVGDESVTSAFVDIFLMRTSQVRVSACDQVASLPMSRCA